MRRSLLILFPQFSDILFSTTMGMNFIFDHLLPLVAPLFVFLLSQIQIFAPDSPYVVGKSAPLASSDLLISTKHIQIYGNRTLTVAAILTISLLSILFAIHLASALWKTSSGTRELPWETETETVGQKLECENPESICVDIEQPPIAYTSHRRPGVRQTFGYRKSSWPEIASPCSRRGWHHTSDFQSLAVAPSISVDGQAEDELEMKELFVSKPEIRESADSGYASRKLHGSADYDDSDWKTIFCEEWEPETSDAEVALPAE